jgi:dihydrofolate synthase/folylpolyglutamate synthase
VSVITNVSLEHQDRLGETIGDISFEKSGIIKKNTPVVTAAKDDALDVVKKIAKEKNSPLTIVDNNYKKVKGGINLQEFEINGSLKTYNVKTSSDGSFQGENIALSIATVEQLQINGIYFTDDAIIEGIVNTVNPGRMEIFSFEPLIILDGAHNIAGINALKKTLKEDFVYDKLILVIGILSDKNIKEMLEIITPISEVVIFTKSQNSRAEDPKKLKEIINEKEVIVKDRIPNAIDYAKEIASKKDMICITGSLFTVGEARDYLQKC